jgi:hypothetical protein
LWAALFGAVGFAIGVGIYLSGLSAAGFAYESRHSDVMMVFCPSLIMTMAIDHASRKEVVEVYGMISLINGILYGLAGMLVATAMEQFKPCRDQKG